MIWENIQRGDNHGGVRARLLKAEAADGAAIHPELLDNGWAHLHLGLPQTQYPGGVHFGLSGILSLLFGTWLLNSNSDLGHRQPRWTLILSLKTKCACIIYNYTCTMLLWLDPRHNVWWSNRACPGVQHVAFRLVHDLKIWSDFIWPRMNVTPSWMSDLKCQPSSHFAKSSLETLLMSTQSPCQSWSMIALELTKGDHHSLPNAWYSMPNVCSKIEVDHEWPLVPVAILPIKRALQACLRLGIYQQFPLTRTTLGSPHALASAQIGSIASQSQVYNSTSHTTDILAFRLFLMKGVRACSFTSTD